jgi:glycosyltransferase involved in cell wall biosynthesis
MISILMPIYNGIEFIEESVSSVIFQTATNWELIIAINGHPENSEIYQTAKKYIEKAPDKIRVLDFHWIKGKSQTLNEMIEYCKYDFVAILDVDDVWHQKKLEIQLPYLDKYDVVGTKCIYFGENTRLNGIVPSIPEGDLTHCDFFQSNPVINSSAIIRKIYAYWSPKWFGIEDYDLWLSLKMQNCKFYNCSSVAVKHRIHSSSAFNAKGNGLGVPDLLNFWRKVYTIAGYPNAK